MDPSKFGEKFPGKLVSISQKSREKDWAFVPSELPADWEFDEALWPVLDTATTALGTLNGIGQILPNPQLLLRPLQNREAIASSRIEGTYVTPEQLLLYELDPREPKAGDERMADWLEVFNYSIALSHGCQRLQELPICNRVIKEMHAKLLRGVRGRDKGPGEFRKWQVQLGSSGRFIPPPAAEIDRLMGNLESYVNTKNVPIHPLVRAFMIHYQFETIHPFGDGNGRIGRALLALMIYKWLDHSMPWLYLSAYFEQYKDEYVDNLFRISTHGDWSTWIGFCLRGTIVQANDSISRCHQFNSLRPQFEEMVGTHTPRTHRIIESLFTTPVVSITSVAKQFHITYHTARSDLEHLAAVGILKEIENAKPRSFFAPAIMQIAYGNAGEEAENLSDNQSPPDS